jgi:sugar phosphate isomerase/epimerase
MAELNRRAFLSRGGLGIAALGGGVLPAGKLAAYPLGIPVGLQLYTIRQECERNLAAALQQVAAIGYRNVEIGGTENLWGRRPRELRQMLCDHCLVCISTPATVGMMQSGWQKYVDEFSELGALYAVCPGFSGRQEGTLEMVRRMADLLNRAGEQSQKSAVRVAFHCHNDVFRLDQGVVAYDELLRRTDPKYVDMELDCFWVTVAGHDPAAYFLRYPGRFSLLHIKDLKPGFPTTTQPLHVSGNPFTEVGRGIIHWRPIFAAARQGGLRYYMVEQDECDRPPLESIKISYRYLRSLDVA